MLQNININPYRANVSCTSKNTQAIQFQIRNQWYAPSVSELDWIRIQSGPWIWIRIWNPDLDPGEQKMPTGFIAEQFQIFLLICRNLRIVLQVWHCISKS
jgi:hypothetical protein